MTRLPRSLKRRLAALVYELLLTGAVTSIAALAAGIVAIFLNPISTRLSMLTTCLILFYAWWLCFRANWRKKGQTLAMTDMENRQPIKRYQPPLPQLRCALFWASILLFSFPCLPTPDCAICSISAQRRIRRRAHLAHPAMGLCPVPSRPPVPL